jgi:hypothetical protein
MLHHLVHFSRLVGLRLLGYAIRCWKLPFVLFAFKTLCPFPARVPGPFESFFLCLMLQHQYYVLTFLL